MVVLFNWKKICSYSNLEVKKILDVIYYITYKPIPTNKRNKFYRISQENWRGNSFLINPERIFMYKGIYTNKELAQYVALASRRNYADYKATRKTTLDILHVPVEISHIKQNRLLRIGENEITFIWETSVP